MAHAREKDIPTEAEQYNLAVCYDMGFGVITNPVQAVMWYRRAAEQGLAVAQFNLGLCYHNGTGVPEDFTEAVMWYRKAAENGHADAASNLGRCYATGDGVAKDFVQAAKWHLKAAERGSATGQYNIGRCYALGEGMPENFVEAYKWLNLASAQGVAWAKEYLPALRARMTKDQIAEAQQLARDFKPIQDSSFSQPTTLKSASSSGTGFCITEDGFLITNAHVVEGAAQVRLVTSAGLISAKVVKVDSANDLALLKAEGLLAPLPITPSRAVKLGGTVVTVGFPNIGLQGFAPKLAKGEIASLSGAQDDARYFQISVPVQPGNSGGALVDERGNVVGVVSAKLNASAALKASGSLPENVNYAVKSSYLLSFLESVPEVAAKLKEPSTKDKKFEDLVKDAEQAAVLVLVY